MRKSSLLTALFLMFSFMGFAQEWHGITSDSPTRMKKTLVSSTEDEIVVDVNIDGFYTNNVTTPNGKQSVIYVDRMASMLEAGAPDLPMEPISVIIGDMAEMTVNVVKSSYVDIPNIEVAPSKGNFSRQINPDDVPYTYGEMYQQDAFWPATQATLEAPYILRDFRGQNIMVRPFAYNPVTKTLRVYTSMTIAMTKVSDNGENQKVSRKSNNIKIDSDFKAAYENRFINFGKTEAKYTFIVDQGSMLVVCVDEYMSAIQPLVDWKNISGRPCTMVGSSTTGTDTQLKAYIQNYYAEHPDLTYILLVGEHNNLPGHSQNGGRSDIYYGMLEGNDLYAEALVGRFSPSNYNDAAQQAARTIYYERDVPAGVTWCNHGMGIGHTDGPGHYNETDWQHMDKIRDTLMHYTYTQVTQRYVNVNNVTNEIISQDINDGISIANYCNHGSATSWAATSYTTSHVNALVNDYKLPYVISVACNNGQFDTGECFGESWMRSVNEQTGAPCGAIGGMFSWISQPWTPPMYGQDEMNRILTEWIGDFHHTMGGVSINGSMFVMDAEPGSDANNTYATWILFGDPSVMLRTDNPTDMNVTTDPSVLLLGMDALTINAECDFGIATLSMNGEVIASEEVVDGTCTLTFPALSDVGVADLVVIGYNKVTYQGTIEIVPAGGAYLTVNANELSAPANYGESVEMSIDIKNVGVETVSNVTVTLSTDNEYINITAEEGTLASLEAGATATIDGFQFEVADNVEDGTRAQINVTMTAGDETWTGKVMVELHAPVIVMSALTVADQVATFEIANTGSAPFYGGTMTITSCSPDLVFTPSTFGVTSAIAGGENVVFTSNYEFAESVEQGTCFEVAYDFTTGQFELDGVFTVAYGSIGQDFESGQFGEGWTFSPNNTAWTIVDGGTKGSKCMKSMNEGLASTEYSATLTLDIMAAGDMTFMYKVSCEQGSAHNWDYLKFEMDGTEKGRWDGQMSEFVQFTQPVTTGTHVFKWTYRKDSSVNSGSDCAWIDDITFPPTSVITFLAPATDLEATVDGHDVALTWTASPDAVSYLVKRDGETLGTVAETSYADYVETAGTYRYQVFALNAGGSMSTPVSTVVEVEFAGVDDNEVSFGVYPNPAESVLYINTNASSFEYQLLNGIGQVMMSGVANGNAELNVSELNDGVYFLKVVANGSAQVEKVVIK
ncbi:MAG: T9SS type A sorting domain-containing protein [Bacteroidales bacterium]|nr:T9SS type A sorting domain-containing protein [Bacteroidales bacterium]